MKRTLLVGCRQAGSVTPSRPDTFSVRLASGAIEEIGSLASLPGERVIDVAGGFVVPGLVDAHVHLELREEEPVVSAQRHAEVGVTAVRDLGRADAACARSAPGLPLCVRAHGALTREGAYGSFLGRALGPGDDVVRAVRGVVASGARVVKIIVSGIVDLERLEVPPPHFTRAELRAMVQTAHEMGATVAAHANGSQSVQWAVEAGVDSVEHGILIDEETVGLMVGAGCVWVPTLTPLHTHTSGDGWPVTPRVLVEHQQIVARGREMGALIAAGTDGGSARVPHGSLHTELALLREAGLTAPEVRDAATVIGARLLGLPGDYGLLRPGARTDLVWFEHDPFERATPAIGSGVPPRPAGRLLLERTAN